MIPLIILFKVLFFYIQLKSDFSNYHGTKKIALKNGGFKKSKYSDKKVGLIFKNPKYKCCTFFQQNYSVSQVLKKLGIVLCFLRDGDISNSLSCTLSFRYCLAMFLFWKEQNFKSSVLPQITLFRLAAFSLLIPFHHSHHPSFKIRRYWYSQRWTEAFLSCHTHSAFVKFTTSAFFTFQFKSFVWKCLEEKAKLISVKDILQFLPLQYFW